MTLYLATVPNPPAGQDWTYTVPGQYVEEIISVTATLNTTANPVTAIDASGSAHPMTYDATNLALSWGNVGPFAGSPNNATRAALGFDRHHGWATTASNTAFNVTTLTIGAWVMVDGGTTSGNVIFSNGHLSNTLTLVGYEFGYNFNLGLLGLGWSLGGIASSAHGITSDVWHHVAVTADGVNVKFYIDGALDATVAGVVTGSVQSDPQMIGDQVPTSPVSQMWQGRMAGVFVNSTALSGATIAGIAANTNTSAQYKTAVNATSPLGLWMLDETVSTSGRTPSLRVTNGSATVGLYTPGIAPAGSGSPFTYSWLNNLSTNVQPPGSSTITAAIPDMILPAGYTIGTNTPDIQSTDQWSNIVIWWSSSYMDNVHNYQPFEYPPGACLEYKQVVP